MPFVVDDLRVFIRPTGLYKTDADLPYQGKTDLIVVPCGFVTDLASVPRFLAWLTPIAGVHDRAVIVHDLNCVRLAEAYKLRQEWRGIAVTPWVEPAKINAVDTDGILLRQLRELGVHEYLARAYWVGVRYGALGNPARREGWLSTAPEVALWTVLLLPVVPAAVLTGVTLAVGRVISWTRDKLRGRVSTARTQRKALADRRKP